MTLDISPSAPYVCEAFGISKTDYQYLIHSLVMQMVAGQLDPDTPLSKPAALQEFLEHQRHRLPFPLESANAYACLGLCFARAARLVGQMGVRPIAADANYRRRNSAARRHGRVVPGKPNQPSATGTRRPSRSRA